jgi:hypothetical protein
MSAKGADCRCERGERICLGQRRNRGHLRDDFGQSIELVGRRCGERASNRELVRINAQPQQPFVHAIGAQFRWNEASLQSQRRQHFNR